MHIRVGVTEEKQKSSSRILHRVSSWRWMRTKEEQKFQWNKMKNIALKEENFDEKEIKLKWSPQTAN